MYNRSILSVLFWIGRIDIDSPFKKSLDELKSSLNGVSMKQARRFTSRFQYLRVLVVKLAGQTIIPILLGGDDLANLVEHFHC